MKGSPVFNPRLVIGLIAGGIVAFTLMLLLIAFSGDIGSSRDGRAHALSNAATGYKGLVTLVGSFHTTRLVRDPEQAGGDLLVVSLEERTAPERVAALLQRRSNLPTLLILPKWSTVPDPSNRGWVRAIGPGVGRAQQPAFPGAEVRANPGASQGVAAAGGGLLSGIRFPLPPAVQTIAGKTLVPLVAVPASGALLAQLPDQPHYVLADPDLVNNQGLRDPERARAALALVTRLNNGQASVAFDLTMNGFGTGSSPSMLRLAFVPPFLAMTLALFAAALLAGLHGAFRFGPARREARAIAFGKTALVENSAGLIRLAEREASLGPAYVDVVREETARTTGAPYWLQDEALDRYLDRLGRPGGAKFSELAVEIRTARSRHGLMAAARALTQWKKEIIR